MQLCPNTELCSIICLCQVLSVWAYTRSFSLDRSLPSRRFWVYHSQSACRDGETSDVQAQNPVFHNASPGQSPPVSEADQIPGCATQVSSQNSVRGEKAL